MGITRVSWAHHEWHPAPVPNSLIFGRAGSILAQHPLPAGIQDPKSPQGTRPWGGREQRGESPHRTPCSRERILNHAPALKQHTQHPRAHRVLLQILGGLMDQEPEAPPGVEVGEN